MRVLVIEDNLFFRPKLETALQAGGHAVTVAAEPGRVEAALAEGVDAVLVNVAARAPWPELVALIRQRAGDTLPIVGYGPHADLTLRDRAIASGCNDVVPNGRIAADAARVVKRYGGF